MQISVFLFGVEPLNVAAFGVHIVGQVYGLHLVAALLENRLPFYVAERIGHAFGIYYALVHIGLNIGGCQFDVLKLDFCVTKQKNLLAVDGENG